MFTCLFGISWVTGRCSDEQRPQEAPAEAPEAVPAAAPAPTESPAPSEVPAEAPTPAETQAETLAQAEAPAQYPSEHLIQSTSEENQIPSHLPVCPSLQHIASLPGSAIIDLFHSSIAEVLAQALLLLPGTCVWRAVGSAVLPVSLRVEQGLCGEYP